MIANSVSVIEIKRQGSEVVLWSMDNATSLAGITLKELNLRNANLVGRNLDGTDFRSTNLSYASLNNAILTNASLQYANLTRADLQGADLSGANLSCANLEMANFDSVNLCKADLRQIKDFGLQLQGATFDYWTRWPTGFDPVKAGAIRIGPAPGNGDCLTADRPWWRIW